MIKFAEARERLSKLVLRPRGMNALAGGMEAWVDNWLADDGGKGDSRERAARYVKTTLGAALGLMEEDIEVAAASEEKEADRHRGGSQVIIARLAFAATGALAATSVRLLFPDLPEDGTTTMIEGITYGTAATIWVCLAAGLGILLVIDKNLQDHEMQHRHRAARYLHAAQKVGRLYDRLAARVDAGTRVRENTL